MKNLYFVDYENLPSLSFEKVDVSADQVVIFVGKNQSKINVDTVIQTQKLGAAIEWMKMDGSGRNALDFHIAYYLGHFAASLEAARVQCNIYVVSKDGDYDILIKHVQSLGHQCHRLTAIDPEAIVVPKPIINTNPAPFVQIVSSEGAGNQENKLNQLNSAQQVYEHLVGQLKKVDKLKRPRTRATLLNHVTAQYQKKTVGIEMEKILNLLIANNNITVNNQRISYHF
ncbi:PIN domain-containing protein [Pseudogulbenkiania subflava]|uniref:PIN domain-containing protein n=1 Tax=Pseudogulbenkiania subflava TaxID=451637 RepID=UPI00117A29C5|nr:PIN domain-containing protein [Pseudogulbenkiania subflava]